MGSRIGKKVIDSEGNITATWYVLDAQGNQMATYEHQTDTEENETLKLSEWMLYGSSRLGVLRANKVLDENATTTTTFAYGRKYYELSNHLGNVLSTISDAKLAVDEYDDGNTDYFEAVVKTQQDYYPFGMLMPERQYTNVSDDYRYGFNGMEKDDEIAGQGNNYTAEFWQYDSRLGRRWNIDPVIKEWESSFATFTNNPILLVDPKGDNAGPIYDSESGSFLGVDSKGFWEGEVLFMDKDKFNQLSENGKNKIDHDVAVKESDYTVTSLPENDKGVKLFEKAYNSIAKAGYKAFEKENVSLFNDKVSAKKLGKSFGYANYNTGYPSETRESGWEKHDITVNFDARADLNTPGNIFSNFYHEYKGHGELNLGNKQHPVIYKMQKDHISFKYTTGKYREHLLNRNQ
jgi:hypothetical protein